MTVATTSICFSPSSEFLGMKLAKLRYLKTMSFRAGSSASRSVLPGGGFIPCLRRNKNSEAIQTIRERGFVEGNNHNNDQVQVQVLEQEAFIHDWFHDVESTLNQLSKWIVTTLFVAFILWRHDGEAIWFAGGSISNAMFSVSLKKILNQKRPSTLKSDPGMPSSHAQSISFTVLFVILSNCLWLFCMLCKQSYLRVSQKLHTVKQVIVGAILGSILSISWYWLWNSFVLEAFRSSLWVRITIALLSTGICLNFLFHVIRQ
ncbi:lipid phosphate phosphatase epsilon 1, chloroplastic-like [Arachis duranensis]|uniref:Lipid phosphate phosphatase epsilon 1, chloroplastic-like n=1 Tax=Arachis duranensis TaxID=130453 RepID=A0A9C6TIN1_ARADU|nr:lipid phosphate phosphatase epsilon 1, chloroplastic-like [Arachis duranensis]